MCWCAAKASHQSQAVVPHLRQAGLSVKPRKRKRLVRVGRPLEAATYSNQEWAIDFVSDAIQSVCVGFNGHFHTPSSKPWLF
jgi:hypothetical protein